MDKKELSFNTMIQHLLLANTQTELSAKTKVEQSTISKLNKGVEFPNITHKNAKAIIKAYRSLPRKYKQRASNENEIHADKCD